MKVAVVILNWNTREYLRSWLPGIISSCKRLDGPNGEKRAEVVVADSGSTDGSIEVVRDEFPEVRLIELGENFGFTGGYDRALAQVDAELYVLLNSDIEVDEGWLLPLVEHMDAHPECGICGPKLNALVIGADGRYERTHRFEYAGAAGGYVDRYGFPYCRGRVLSKVEEDHGQYDTVEDVLWVSGACMMTRSSLWKKLGGLDDRFFAHMEEIDYCWRAQLAGYKVTVIPGATVYHLGGGTLNPSSPFKLKLNYRNNLMLLKGNLAPTVGKVPASLRFFVRLLVDGASAVLYLLTGNLKYVSSVFNGHREYWKMSRTPFPPRPLASGRKVVGYKEKTCILIKYLTL